MSGPVPSPDADHRYLGTRQVDETTWDMPMTPGLLNILGGLYGGAGVAAAAATAESATGRPLRWVTCQFVDSAYEGETVRVSVSLDKHGHNTSQVGVAGTVGDRVVFRAVAACGKPREGVPAADWIVMPEVPAPEDCPDLALEANTDADTAGTSMEPVQRRHASGPALEEFIQDEPRPRGFQMSFWSRMLDADSGSPAMLGWLGDVVPMSVVAGLGAPVGGKSLDNTLRMVERTSADWVLIDLRPTATNEGYAYGDVHFWARDGRLLATASQTAILRPWDLSSGEPAPPRAPTSSG